MLLARAAVTVRSARLVDGFHRPGAERYRRGRRSALGYWLDAYDYEGLTRTLLDPFGRGEPVRTAVHDVRTDAVSTFRRCRSAATTSLIVDGVLVHRDELVPYWDFSLYLHVDLAVSLVRMSAGTTCRSRPPRATPGAHRSTSTPATRCDGRALWCGQHRSRHPSDDTTPLGRLAGMESWPAPLVPRLPGTGLPLRAARHARPGRSARPRPAPTRPDVRLRHHPVRRHPPRPRRHLRRLRPGATGSGATPATTVHYVQNVTDIDDPLLERADRDGEDWIELAMRETALFREDMDGAARCCRRDALRRRGRVDPARSSTTVDELLDAGRGLPTSTTAPATSTSTSRRRPASATSPDLDAATRCWRSSPSAAATPTGRASATRSTRCCGGPPAPGEPSWDRRRSARAGPAGTSSARRSRCDHLGDALRRAGRRQRPGLPAPRDARAAHAEALTGDRPVRPALRARRHGRPRRREDVASPGQPGLRLPAARATASTRWRSGWRCSPTTTAPTGTWTDGPARRGRGAAGPLAARPSRRRRPVRRPRCWPGSASGWPTTSTPPARSRRSTAGPTSALARGGDDADGAAGWSRDTVDALLGVAARAPAHAAVVRPWLGRDPTRRGATASRAG